MAAFVLVPGAWCGAWSWQWVAPLLRDAGHAVHPVALSGVGERVDLAHPGITLDTHITDVVTALEFADLREVILVGESYAGMIITGVTDRVPERLAQVIYLDAVVPEDGQSYFDLWPDGAEMREDALREAEAAGTPGLLPPPPFEGLAELVPDEAVRTVIQERVTPHPLATFAQPIHLANPDAAARVPHVFVSCTGTDEPAPPFLTRIHADPAWRYVEIPFNHLASIAAPRETAEALLALI